MRCCCLKILNLCLVPVCGSLEIELAAAGASGSGETNEYKLVLDYLQTQITITQSQVDGDNITFDVSMLNENLEYTGQIFDPAGNVVKITIGDDEFDCIKFKTIMNVLSY